MRMNNFILILVGIIFSGVLFGQDYPRDTSYNIESAYRKLVKYHPDITPIKPEYLDGVQFQKDVVYSTPGRPLTLDVYYPEDQSKTYPVVLLIFGGGWSSGEKANQVPMAQRLAQSGYVGVIPEYRLSPEIEYPAGVHDLKAALRWIRTNADDYSIDADKIATLGCSAGAQLATLLGVTFDVPKLEGSGSNDGYTGQVDAIINVDGIVSFIHPDAEEGKYAAKWLGGYKDEVPQIWKEASPLEYVGENTPPTLFINSSQPRFHAGRDDMIGILDEYDIYSEVHTLEGSPHSFWLVHPWFEPTVNYTVDFLDKVFK